VYNNLRAEMARNNVTVGNLAEILNVRYATVSDKLNGRFRFYYDEAIKIRNHFFPDCSLEYLFEAKEPAKEKRRPAVCENQTATANS